MRNPETEDIRKIIRKTVKICDVLNYLGGQLYSRDQTFPLGTCYTFDGKTIFFSVDECNNSFFGEACGTGDIIELVKKVKGSDTEHAVKWVVEKFVPELSETCMEEDSEQQKTYHQIKIRLAHILATCF